MDLKRIFNDENKERIISVIDENLDKPLVKHLASTLYIWGSIEEYYNLKNYYSWRFEYIKNDEVLKGEKSTLPKDVIPFYNQIAGESLFNPRLLTYNKVHEELQKRLTFEKNPFWAWRKKPRLLSLDEFHKLGIFTEELELFIKQKYLPHLVERYISLKK